MWLRMVEGDGNMRGVPSMGGVGYQGTTEWAERRRSGHASTCCGKAAALQGTEPRRPAARAVFRPLLSPKATAAAYRDRGRGRDRGSLPHDVAPSTRCETPVASQADKTMTRPPPVANTAATSAAAAAAAVAKNASRATATIAGRHDAGIRRGGNERRQRGRQRRGGDSTVAAATSEAAVSYATRNFAAAEARGAERGGGGRRSRQRHGGRRAVTVAVAAVVLAAAVAIRAQLTTSIPTPQIFILGCHVWNVAACEWSAHLQTWCPNRFGWTCVERRQRAVYVRLGTDTHSDVPLFSIF